MATSSIQERGSTSGGQQMIQQMAHLSMDDPASTDTVTARRRANALRPISKLPPELLARIFCAYAALPKFNEAPSAAEFSLKDKVVVSYRRQIGTGWLDVVQVCHEWRETAFECPALWSSVPFPLDWGQHWARQFSALSGAMPIDIVVGRESHRRGRMGTWVEDFVKAHKFRLRGLAVGFTVSEKKWIQEVVDIDAPVLTHVDVFYAYSWPGDHAKYIHGGPFSAPELRDLVVFRVSPDLSMASWPNLRNLQLVDIPFDASQLQSALATTPLLERLLIRQLRHSYSIPAPSPSSTIHLDHLERIDVTGDSDGVMAVWGTLVVPSLAVVRLSFEQPTRDELRIDGREESLTTILSATRQHMDRLAYPLPGLSLEVSRDALIIAAYPEPEGGTLPFKDDARVIEVQDKQSSSRPYDFVAVIRAMPMHTCRLLELSAMIHWFYWADVLEETAHIEVLCLSACGPETTENLAKAALYSTRKNGPTLFPRLHTLHLYSVFYDSDDPQPDVVPPALLALRKWLERRDHCGVRKLRIQECSVFAEWVDIFRQIDGLVVEWDGDVRFCRGPNPSAIP
ncbi:unnamed protein product [Peniophora sp. CBMAI 1063]|nr:unnamed protein product [Peniophora sp. CBMAI 1063]